MSSNKVFWQWSWVVLVAIAVTFAIINLIGQDQFSWAGLLIGLALVIALFGFLGWRNRQRLHNLTSLFPNSYVGQLILYSQLIPQLKALSGAEGTGQSLMRAARYASLVVDKSKIRIFGGGNNPKELFSISTRDVSDITIRKAAQGKWMLDSIELNFEHRGGMLSVDLCLVRWSAGMARVIRGEALGEELSKLRKELSDKLRS